MAQHNDHDYCTNNSGGEGSGGETSVGPNYESSYPAYDADFWASQGIPQECSHHYVGVYNTQAIGGTAHDMAVESYKSCVMTLAAAEAARLAHEYVDTAINEYMTVTDFCYYDEIGGLRDFLNQAGLRVPTLTTCGALLFVPKAGAFLSSSCLILTELAIQSITKAKCQ